MRRSLPSILLALATACAAAGPSSDELGATVSRVPNGKADDYYSNVAVEFEVRGELPVEIPSGATEEERLRAARGRVDAVVLYLTTYLTKKLDDFFSNTEYGGYAAMVRNQTREAMEITEGADGETLVHFAVDVAGPPELPTLLGNEFGLRMPAGMTNDGSGSLGVVRSFDPDRYAGELETVRCTIARIPEARNGYPEYAAFFEDGVFDITLFQGHDYNDVRSDLYETFELVWTLESGGFSDAEIDYLPEADPAVRDALNGALGEQAADYAAIVDRVARLHPDSGAYVKTLQVDGRSIRAEARLFHSEMFRDDRPGQRQRAIDELVGRDVFFYNGHAGPWYGFYLDAAGRAEIDETEFAGLPFTDRQQLVIANGCQTYSQYADMLYASPAKSEANLDVITTVNYSYGRGSEMLLGALTQTDEAGDHIAWSYGDLIRAFNQDDVNDEHQVFYGVTGIDGNDKLHPYARPDLAGQACSSGWDCGNAYGNVCGGTCAPRALSAEGCPAGTTFAPFANGDTIEGGACWR